jgi:hypothetical protein
MIRGRLPRLCHILGIKRIPKIPSNAHILHSGIGGFEPGGLRLIGADE